MAQSNRAPVSRREISDIDGCGRGTIKLACSGLFKKKKKKLEDHIKG